MADNELALRISAKTDKFVKSVEDAKTKVRSLSMQMAEIDKQLKTESVDRVKKLADKLDLAKRASEAAAKEAEYYGDKIKKLTDKNEDLNNLTDRQKESLLKLSEQMATAQRKAETYAAEVDKLQKEYEETTKATDNANTETENLTDSLEDASKKTENLSENINKGKENTRNFFQQLKEGVAVKLTSGTLSKIAGWFADIAAKAWNAAKATVSFAKEYAVEAVNLAADYADALGYSEQVFDDQAEAVQKWVKDNSVALRINKSDLQGYVNSMGSLYRSFGMTSEQAAKYSEGLITLATDLRAATGDDTKQIIESLTSVMTGGYKSGYKYGIVINEAAVKAKALSMGLVDVAVDETKVEKARLNLEKATKKASEATLKYGEDSLEAREAQLAVEAAAADFEEALGGQTLALTQAQKEAAIYALEMEQTAHLQGQGARESGNYKSQLDALKTTFENLHISIGEKLLPVFNGFVTEFNKFIESEEGKAFLDGIVESVENISEKVLEFIENGKLTEWFNNAREKLPEITDKIIEISEKVAEFIPDLITLTEKLLALFGIKSEAQAAKDAFMQVSNQVENMAEQYNISLETAKTAVNEFAQTNGLKVSEVYENWSTYEPQIVEFMTQVSGGAADMETEYNKHVSELAPELQKAVTDITAVDLTPYDQHLAKMNQSAQDNAERIVGAWNWIKTTAQNVLDWFGGKVESMGSKGWKDNLSWEGRDGMAAGGPVRAGQMYRVNDDHGRRTEMFVPAVNGYILNGQDTQRIINNSTNNSRTYGDVNVYVNSYGTDAASIAEEIGAEVNRKLRMAGAW